MPLCLVAEEDLTFGRRRIGVRAHSPECVSPNHFAAKHNVMTRT
jgi:hypothetical protein